MKGEWCYFKQHFTQQQCEKIQQIIKVRPYNEASIGLAGGKTGVESDAQRPESKNTTTAIIERHTKTAAINFSRFCMTERWS
jgi:hypothetical protein